MTNMGRDSKEQAQKNNLKRLMVMLLAIMLCLGSIPVSQGGFGVSYAANPESQTNPSESTSGSSITSTDPAISETPESLPNNEKTTEPAIEIQPTEPINLSIMPLSLGPAEVGSAVMTVSTTTGAVETLQSAGGSISGSIEVPYGYRGDVVVTITSPTSVSSSSIAFSNDSTNETVATTTTHAVDFKSPEAETMNITGNITWNDGSAEGATVSINIQINESIPSFSWLVGLAGKEYTVEFTNLEDYQFVLGLETNQAANEIRVSCEGRSQIPDFGPSVTTAAGVDGAVIYTFPTTGTYTDYIRDSGGTETNFKLTINYVIPPPSGGSSSSSSPAEAPIDVVNETNKPQETSDTTLVPGTTQESGGVSTTNLSSNEINALIKVAEEHKEDVPDGEQKLFIKIEDGEGVENNEYLVNMSGDDFKKLVNSSADVLGVVTKAGDFNLRTKDGRNWEFTSSVTIKLGKIKNGDKPGIDATLMDGQKIVTILDGVYSVEIKIPYKPAEGEDLSALVIEYIREDGTKEIVTECKYDPVSETVSFFPSHLSKYGVSYNPKFFKDVKSTHWANGYITFLASRGIINGRDDGRFRPDDMVSKAEFVTMMTKAFSAASLGKKTVRSYKDVPINEWYAKSVGWSYINNISNVIAKNGNFNPNAALSREDMATLSNNISRGLGLRLKSKAVNTNFKDGKQIASYAKSGVMRMTSCGILAGNASGNFMPKYGLTRAEASKTISTLMTGMR